MCYRYIARALETVEGFDPANCSPSEFSRFCGLIGEDGVMTLKLTAANSSELLVRDVICNMFNQWRGKDGMVPKVEEGTYPENIKME